MMRTPFLNINYLQYDMVERSVLFKYLGLKTNLYMVKFFELKYLDKG